MDQSLKYRYPLMTAKAAMEAAEKNSKALALDARQLKVPSTFGKMKKSRNTLDIANMPEDDDDDDEVQPEEEQDEEQVESDTPEKVVRPKSSTRCGFEGAS